MAHREKQFNGRECAELANELMEVERERDYYRAALAGEQVAHRLTCRNLAEKEREAARAFQTGIYLTVLVFAVTMILVWLGLEWGR